jgi:DUF971 family protein
MNSDVEMIRVTDVELLGGFALRLRFNDGTERIIDFEDRLHGEVFEPLKKTPSCSGR